MCDMTDKRKEPANNYANSTIIFKWNSLLHEIMDGVKACILVTVAHNKNITALCISFSYWTMMTDCLYIYTCGRPWTLIMVID